MPIIPLRNRAEHPQLKLIPEDIFARFFNINLKGNYSNINLEAIISEEEIELIKTPTNDLKAKLNKILLSGPSSKQKERIWLCIACGHPTLNDTDLADFAKDLSLKFNSEICEYIAKRGLVKVMQTLIDLMPQYYSSKEMIHDALTRGRWTDMFSKAIEGGHVEMLDQLIWTEKHETKNIILNYIAGISQTNFTTMLNKAVTNGHVEMLNRLIKLAGEYKTIEFNTSVKKNFINADTFRNAVRSGNVEMLERVMELAGESGTDIKAIIPSIGINLLDLAIKSNNPKMLDRVMVLAKEKNVDIKVITSSEINLLFSAVKSNSLDMLGKAVGLAEENKVDVNAMIAANNYDMLFHMLRLAIFIGGGLAMMNELIRLSGSNIKELIEKNPKLTTKFQELRIVFNEEFILSIRNGNLDRMNELVKLAKSFGINFDEMITYQNYKAFQTAKNSANFEILDTLIELATREKSADDNSKINIIEMVTAGNTETKASENKFFTCIVDSIENGQVNLMNKLIELAKNTKNNSVDFEKLIKYKNYRLFYKAVVGDNVEIFNKVIELAEANKVDIKKMLEAQSLVDVFVELAANGNFEMLKRLIEFVKKHEAPATGLSATGLIESSLRDAFLKVAAKGQLGLMDELLNLATDHKVSSEKMKKIIFNVDLVSAALGEAAANDHPEMMNELVKFAKTNGIDVKALDLDLAFSNAMKNGHLDVIDRLVTLADTKEINLGPPAFCTAITEQYYRTAYQLLAYPKNFDFAEQHVDKYGVRVCSFVTNKIAELRQRAEQSNSTTPFNLTDADEILICIYMARNLIRRNDSYLSNDLNFLLSIPAVRLLALAHTDGEEPLSNSLCRMAENVGNRHAALRLISIPDMYDLAVANNIFNNATTLLLLKSPLAAPIFSIFPRKPKVKNTPAEELVNQYLVCVITEIDKLQKNMFYKNLNGILTYCKNAQKNPQNETPKNIMIVLDSGLNEVKKIVHKGNKYINEDLTVERRKNSHNNSDCTVCCATLDDLRKKASDVLINMKSLKKR